MGKRDDFDFLSIFDIEVQLTGLAMFSFIFTLFFLTSQVKLKPFSERLFFIIRNLLDTDHRLAKRLSAIAFIVIFYNLYFVIFKYLITLNIKSSLVVLNTSSIVDNTDDLLKTNDLSNITFASETAQINIYIFIRLVCWVKNENENLMAKQSPKNSIIGKVYGKKQYNFYKDDYSKCELEKRVSFKVDRRYTRVVFIMVESKLASAFAFLGSQVDSQIFFMSESPFFEIASVYYYRAELEFKLLAFFALQAFECGLEKQVDDKMAVKISALFQHNSKIYRKKKELFVDFAKFTNVNYNYFGNLFHIILIFYLTLFVVFILNLSLGPFVFRFNTWFHVFVNWQKNKFQKRFVCRKCKIHVLN